MATLKGLKAKIEAGKTVKKRSKSADGYEAVDKQDGKYVYTHNFEHKTFDTFKELYKYVEPDADWFKDSPEYLDEWEIDPGPTEEEIARAQPLIDALKAGDEEAVHEILKDKLVKQMEVSMFQDRRLRKYFKSNIVLLRKGE